ncbi:hypothetical protein BKA61DRAFT_577762 [Leptodontidium sp. MPI-SDFR-AT-0119]|nr:hypothetical protein BKA61DRAFT_577762 [Leptodontidium sp. MPI-SDFR-AT-0119]
MATPNQLMVTAPETLPTPILFKIEGMEPDTQLQVFDQTFLVHSSALKLHSTYFRKFLDSPDKPTTFTGKYRYSWVTKLDGNGPEWSLVSDHTMEPGVEENLSGFSGDKRAAGKGFHAFLCAIYNRPYAVESTVELQTLANHGDYYMAMPAVSATVFAAVRKSGSFVRTLPGSASKVIVIAAKMRNEELFRECLVYLINPWVSPRYTSLEDPAILHSAKLAYNQLCARVSKAQEALVLVANAHPVRVMDGATWEHAVGGLLFRGASGFIINGRILLPKFFRTIYAAITANGHPQAREIENILKPLFKNNLMLTGAHAIAGEDVYQDSFLCVEIEDVDLPWDVTEEPRY